MAFFGFGKKEKDKMKTGLEKTRTGFWGSIMNTLTGSVIDDEMYDDLEEQLILADVGGEVAVDLVDKGVRPGDEVAGILRTLTGQHQEWMAERLLEHGMPVEPDNYDALYACVSNQAVGAAKLLLDRGIDLEQYQLWAEHRPKGDGYTETMEELAAYWSELQNSTQPEDSPMKGMNL